MTGARSKRRVTLYYRPSTKAVCMSELHEYEPRERRFPSAGIFALLIAGGLTAAFYEFPFMHAWWPRAFFPLFWFVVGSIATFGMWTIVWYFLPATWVRRLPGISRYRVMFPREGIGFLLIMMVLFIGSSLTQSNMLLLVFAVMAGPFVVNGWITFNMLQGLRVHRHPPARAMASELFSVEILLENQSSLLSAWMMTVQDDLFFQKVLSPSSVLFVRVPPHESQVGYYQLQLSQRGKYEFGPLRVTTRFPLGLIERSLIVREGGTTLVYPRIGRLSPAFKRQLLGASEQVEVSKSRSGVFDDEFHTLRDYRTGDNPRAIHWRSSARRGTLIVREYHQNREHNLQVMIDLSGTKPEYAGQTEAALSLALTLCVEYRQECRGGHLTVVCGGREPFRWEASAMSSGLDQLLDWLALVEAAPDEHFALIARETLEQVESGTRVVVVSTRKQEAAPWGRTVSSVRGMPVQWLEVTPQRFAQAVVFPETGPTARRRNA